MTIDIICPLYKAEKYIENLHKSLLMQEKVEVKNIKYILTVSGDKTEDILKQLNINYEKIQPTEFSHSLTREKAAKESSADIIVFITQDIIIKDKLWLYYLTKDIEEGICDEAYSRQIAEDDGIEKYTREINYPEQSKIVTKKDVEELGIKTFFSSDASSAIKREVFEKLNYYDAKKLPTSEDMYITYKLIMNGYKVKYCANSVIFHSHDYGVKENYKKYYDIGKFFKQNNYLNQYKVIEAGGGMAKYILKRAWQDRNWKVFLKFIPNMISRFIGMYMGKILYKEV